MKRIKIITASAGTGKTTRLAEELKTALTTGKARPEALIATTFTRKAAAELQERARTHLIEEGETELAERLQASRIGTVNSICGQLVSDFAFELGVSPDVRVLDEQAAAQQLEGALAAVLEGEEERELAVLADMLRELQRDDYHDQRGWQGQVRRVVELARVNGIEPERFAECATKSWSSLQGLLAKPQSNGAALEKDLAIALKEFVALAEGGGDTTAKTREGVERATKALATLEQGEPLSWSEWGALTKLEVAKKSSAFIAPVNVAAQQHESHPQLHQDLKRAIELVFELARRALATYAERKLAWGVIDFVDQEVLALKLLRLPQVREQLREEIDLVLVDEFQDTSPLQLALFLELAELAKQSVWVGDAKQAIFGFRGADPALMTAALEVLGGSDPAFLDTTLAALSAEIAPPLHVSYRSRPELVNLTSELFARAFAEHGVDESQVRLTAHMQNEAADLGVAIESWDLQIPHKGRTSEYPVALAAGIKQLLADATVQVRDRRTAEIRALQPGDVAVLTRKNAACDRLAVALNAQGIKAALPRAGLLASAEALLVQAGLRLWLDPQDALAKAEIARLMLHAQTPDTWLLEVLTQPNKERFVELQSVAALVKQASEHRDAGPVLAMELCMTALSVRDVCRRWGSAPQRLANLDALRALAVRYTETRMSEGLPCTLASLLAYFDELANEGGADTQAVVSDADAVVVSTWHAAKGLEWPVTVLFELDYDRPAEVLGVHIASRAGAFDLTDPLGGRWIRYWPGPYHPKTNGLSFHARLNASAESTQAHQQHEREQLRLLYVGWTRARDRLVLAAPEDKLTNGALKYLRQSKRALVTAPTEDVVEWADRQVELVRRVAAPQPAVAMDAVASPGYNPSGMREYPPLTFTPSRAVANFPVTVGRPTTIAPPPKVTFPFDAQRLGLAVHSYLACDQGGQQEARHTLATEILTRWKVDSIDATALLTVSDALTIWVDSRWPNAKWRREWPIQATMANGSTLQGTADLVVELPDGFVVIDHKSLLGSIGEDSDSAKEFAGQLAAYADSLARALNKPVFGTFIHLPLRGEVVEIGMAP